jgi:hypothetical protein
MAAKRDLSDKLARWEMVPYRWEPIGCAFCVFYLGFSTCTSAPNLIRVKIGGRSYSCVHASLKLENRRGRR